MKRISSALIAATLALAGAARAAAAQGAGGVVTGRVTDAGTSQPVAEAQVVVVGTTVGGRTDAAGRYRIVNAPTGSVNLRVVRIGFLSQTRPVSVAAGQPTTQDFALQGAPTLLEATVVTASGTEERKVQNGAAVAVVNADSINKGPIQNFSELVSGRTAGVTVSQSTGTTGFGARIRIRGANSLSLSNEPLLIIDGVRIDNDPNSNSIGVGGQTPSRLNDINPEDIDSYEVIKGPAAAALYGTAAANGVIQITTKHGAQGQTEWNVYSEQGLINENNRYPANYGGFTSDSTYIVNSGREFPGADPTKPTPLCNLVDAYAGACTIDSLSRFNTIESTHPFRQGRRQKTGVSVAGGSNLATYFLGADDEKESGIYTTSNLDRLNLRANVVAHPNSAIDLQVNSGFVRSGLQLPQNDNNYYGVIADGLAGWPGPGPTQGYNPIGPDQFNNIQTRQDINRFTGGLNGTWRTPLSWLSMNGTLGIDDQNRLDSETLQPNLVFFSDAPKGERTSNRFSIINYTANYAAAARFSLSETISSTTQAGYQYQEASSQNTFGFGKSLTAGSSSLTGVTSDKTVSEGNIDNKTVGGFASEQLAFGDRFFATGTLRGDKNSAFGKNFGFIYYPAVSLSWVALQGTAHLDQLRLRSAYGQSGLRPGILDAFAYSVPAPARLDSADRPGITAGNLANPNLKAERSGELEVGFDASALQNRASLEVTYYDKKSRDALVSRPLPPSLGGPASEYFNLGAVSNRGLEVQLGLTPIRTTNYLMNLTVTGSGNRNRLTQLGDTTPIIFGLSSSQRHAVGYPLGGYWGTVVDSFKVDPDGRIDPNKVYYKVGDENAKFLGSAFPVRQGSVAADLTFFRVVKVSTLFEHRGGVRQFNASEQFRCLSFVSTCRGLNDVKAPAAERANAIAVYESGGAFYGGYIEDASFTKWRELAVTVSAPHRFATALRGRDASITLAGRNLHTWTKYTGLDPEVNVSGQSNFSQADFLTQPQVRYFTARLNLTF